MPIGPGAPATVTLGSGEITNFAFKVTNISRSGYSRGSVDLTNYGSATAAAYYMGTNDATHIVMEKKPAAVVDPGQLRLEGYFDADLEPPIGEDIALVTVTFAPSSSTITTNAVWSCPGFATDFEFDLGGMDGAKTGTLTVELSSLPGTETTNVPLFTAEGG